MILRLLFWWFVIVTADGNLHGLYTYPTETACNIIRGDYLSLDLKGYKVTKCLEKRRLYESNDKPSVG